MYEVVNDDTLYTPCAKCGATDCFGECLLPTTEVTLNIDFDYKPHVFIVERGTKLYEVMMDAVDQVFHNTLARWADDGGPV